jgi:chromosome segregation ATPase
LKELKGAKERVVALEGELATKDQVLSQFEQKVAELAEKLDREKKGQDLLRAELSTKADLVAEVQQKLAAALSSQAELANEIEKSRKEIAELKIQLKGLKAQQASGESAAVSVEVKPKPTSASEGSGKQGESPNPADLINGALQKKAK